MGTVYRATQTTMDRDVAVKVLHPDLIENTDVVKRFQREARAAARLHHPNIITLYIVGETANGIPFAVMEFVEGNSLAGELEVHGRFDSARTIHIARQISGALTEAHANGVIHRDLKPANILLRNQPSAPGLVKVVDFGIAKLSHDADQSRLSQTGAIFGTPHYLSPEQATGGDVDPRSDLYSLGVVLYEMLSGRVPFHADNGIDVLVRHVREAPRPISDLGIDVPTALEDLVLRLLEKRPADRYQTAGSVDDALAELSTDLFRSDDFDLTKENSKLRADLINPARTIVGLHQSHRAQNLQDDPTPQSATDSAESGDGKTVPPSHTDENFNSDTLSGYVRPPRTIGYLLIGLLCFAGGGVAAGSYFWLGAGSHTVSEHARNEPKLQTSPTTGRIVQRQNVEGSKKSTVPVRFRKAKATIRVNARHPRSPSRCRNRFNY